MYVEFRLKRATALDWSNKNPVLASGEPGLEIDTGKFRIGDGMTRWDDLPSFLHEDLVGGGGTVDPRIGDLDDLTTEAKSTVVASLNEVNDNGISYTLLYDNAKAG